MADITIEQATLEKLHKEAQNLLPNFYKIWREIGYDSNAINKFSSDFFNNTQGLWLEMLSETKERKNGLIEKIGSLHKQITFLENKLNLDVIFTISEDEPLIILEDKMENYLDELEKIKEKRVTEVKRLLAKEKIFCESLGKEPVGMTNNLPSNEEIKKFNLYLTQQESELHNLKKSFEEIRKSVMTMMEEILYVPKHDFERLVCNKPKNFVFSSSNMKELSDLHDRIKNELENMRKTADNKRNELINLWRYLEVSEENYREFLKRHSGFDTATIAALNKEIADCKEIRKKSIAQFIEKLREDLTIWWDICKFSKVQRDAFKPFHYETYTEDILALHEVELAQVQKFYNDNSEIYDLLNKREEMWEQMKELQQRAEDPDRLQNRGGQLLAEEKMRKYFNKNLPKIESQLGKLIDEYEEKHGVPFTIHGLTIVEYVKQQVAEHQAQMEVLKQAKAKMKDEKKSAKKTPLSTSRRTPGITTSMRAIQTSVKRKQIDRSPLSTLNKAPRMASSENTRLRVHGSKIRRSGQVARRLLKSPLNKSRTPKQSINKMKTIDVSSSTACSSSKENPYYEEFKDYLGDKDELRSTIVPEMNITITKPKKKLVKTPIKPSRKHVSPITPRITPRTQHTSNSLKSPKISSTPRFAAAPTNIQHEF